MNEQKAHWDDLGTILAIAATGSLSGAARRLGVSHATVYRRLGAIEKRLGVRLFERSRTGYTPTPAGEDLARTAEHLEAEVLAAERRVVGQDLQPSGNVAVTTTDSLLFGLLSPVFRDFRASHPEISLDVAISNQLFNLSKREADVAIRPSNMPPETLVGRRIAVLEQAVYGRADAYDPITTHAALRAFSWVGPSSGLYDRPLQSWMTAVGVDACCPYRVDTLMGLLAAVRTGTGVAVLPCYLGDGDPLLARLTDPVAELARELWLLTHPDLRRVARIRALMEFTAQAVKARLDA